LGLDQPASQLVFLALWLLVLQLALVALEQQLELERLELVQRRLWITENLEAYEQERAAEVSVHIFP